MKNISEKESEIANILNEKRQNSYIDIYKETEFLGLGILIKSILELDIFIHTLFLKSLQEQFSEVVVFERNKLR